MIEAVFAVPGDLAAPTGGYAYARRMLELLPAEGVAVRHLALPGSFPDPSAADLRETARRLGATPPDAVLLVDGLACGALPPALLSRMSCPVVALVHHPLGFEAGLSAQRRAALLASERAALASVGRVVTTSRMTRRILRDEFGVPSARISVAEPGTDPVPRSIGSRSPVRLLSVGTVSPRKGYDVLVEALAGLKDLDWRATLAGSLDREPAAAAALRAAIARQGLADRLALAGAVHDAELEDLYRTATVFVSSSLFEGYGMVLAEAMARGLPLVVSTGGAAGETVPEHAGLRVPPGDVAALREALRRMITEPATRRAYADASWAAGQRLPRWRDTAARLAAALEAAAPKRAGR